MYVKYKSLTCASGCADFSQTAVKVEFVVPPSRLLIIGTGVVGGFILLIIILVLLLKVRTNQVILRLISSVTAQILNPICVCLCLCVCSVGFSNEIALKGWLKRLNL